MMKVTPSDNPKVNQERLGVALFQSCFLKQGVTTSWTDDDDIKFFKQSNEKRKYILIDGEGGVAFNVIGRPGKGCSSEYYEYKSLTEARLSSITKEFLAND